MTDARSKYPIFPSDREPLHHFAGRLEELSALSDKLTRVFEEKRGAHRAGISLISGVPGIGKTELSSRFVAKALSERPDLHGGVKAVELKTHILANPLDTFLEITTAIGNEDLGRKIAEVDESTTSFSAGAVGVKGGKTWDRERVTRTFTAMMNNLGRQWPKADCGALIVCVDELQTASDEAAPVLQILHQGTEGCPIMLIGAGLQHTADILDGIGISRINPPLKLGPLSYDERREAIEGNLEHYAGVDDLKRESLDAIADSSFGHPAHLHGYLAPAVKTALELGTESLNDEVVLSRVIAAGDDSREVYYKSRLASMSVGLGDRDAVAALVPLVKRMSQLPDDARIMHGEAVSICDRPPFDGREVIRQAKTHGILTVEPNSPVTFGIPSFKAYMIDVVRGVERDPGGIER